MTTTTMTTTTTTTTTRRRRDDSRTKVAAVRKGLPWLAVVRRTTTPRTNTLDPLPSALGREGAMATQSRRDAGRGGRDGEGVVG